MGTLAVTVLGEDRPGIVAAVTRVLADARCNLEDTSSALLRGHFTMTLVVAGPDAATVEQALAPVAERLHLVVAVREVASAARPPDRAQTAYVLTVHGADRAGIVARVSEVVASYAGNITDLTTRLGAALYVLSAEVALPPSADVEALNRDLATVGAELGVEVSLRPVDADLL